MAVRSMSTLHFQSHGLLRGGFMLCLDDSVHPGYWPGEAQFGCGKLQKANCVHWVMEEPRAIFPACQLETLPREFSTPIPLLTALYFQQFFLLNSCKLIYILYRKGTEADKTAALNTAPVLLERRYFKTRYFRAMMSLLNLQMAVMHLRKGRRILFRCAPNCAFEYNQKYSLWEE